MPSKLTRGVQTQASRECTQNGASGSQSFFATIFTPDNAYVKAFDQISAKCPANFYLPREVEKGLGILRAAQTEIDFGALPGIETLFSAEIFEDFLARWPNIC